MTSSEECYEKLRQTVRDKKSDVVKVFGDCAFGSIDSIITKEGKADHGTTWEAITGESEDEAKKRIALEHKARYDGKKIHTLSDSFKGGTKIDFRILKSNGVALGSTSTTPKSQEEIRAARLKALEKKK
jgi:hypothetical protein